MKKLRIISMVLILIFCAQCCAFAAPRIPVYKVGNVLFFLDKSSGTITGFAGDPKDLVIPTSLGGYKVVSIGTGAFSGSTTLRTLTVPDGIVTISAEAFANCPNLTSVKIGSTVSYIGSRAFSGCKSLDKVTFSDTPSTIEPDAFNASSFINSTSVEFVIIGETLLKYNGSSETVTVPDGIKSIAANAFAYNKKIKSVILPEGLQEIGANAFVHCYALEKIKIPKSLSHIGVGAFDDTIWLNDNGEEFTVANGILLSYKGSDKHVTVPPYVTAIGAGAFMANDELLSVYLPDSVIYIDSMAFGGCKSLLLVNIPMSVEWIDEYAFSQCDNVTLYGGYESYAKSYAKYMDIAFSHDVYVSYNGKKVNFDTAVPIIYYDRTFLPLRSLMELMGFKVEWDASTKTAICTKGDRVVTVNKKGEIFVNGVASPTVAPPINVRGSSLVSARVIAEAVDARVEWNESARTVEIYY